MSNSFSKRIENIAGHLRNSVLNLIPGDTMATNGVNGSGSRGTMKAQQIDHRDLKVHLNEVPIPSPDENQILVKIICASLCHSDIMVFEPNEAMSYPDQPITLGHEATGQIVELGPSVKGFNVGDKVGFLPAMNVCYECMPCKTVHNLWCENSQPKMQGFALDGFFAEYAVVDYHNAIVLPEKMDPVAAAPLFCAGVTAFHAIDDLKLDQGSWVAVIGCGGLGLLGIKYAKAMGYRVIALDVNKGALEVAKNSGAEHVFDTSAATTDDGTNYIQRILSLTNNGVDAAVNFTASKKAYDAMPSIIRPGRGIFMVVGIPQQPLEINAYDIALGRYRVMGANNGMCYNMKKAIDFSAEHDIVSHVEYFSLEELPVMVDKMQQHKAVGRMAVKF